MTAPVPTALTPTTRYIGAGTRRFVFVPTMANYNSPTKAEVSAGTDLTKEIKADGVEGFVTTSDTVDAPDYGTRFTSKVAGMISSDDSSLTFYANKNGINPVATLLARDTSGFIIDAQGGLTATGKMSVFPVTVTVSSATQDGAGETVGWRVGFAVTNVPAENIAVPTS